MTVCVELNKASPSNFELSFPLLPGQTSLLANEELVLNIHGTILPALSIPEIVAEWQGTKHKLASSAPDFEIMNIQFVVDAKFKNWQLLFNWMTYITNNKDKMMDTHFTYAVDATLRMLDNFNNTIIAVNFKGLWPTNLQEVTFSHKEGEVLLEGGATFVYDYFELAENV